VVLATYMYLTFHRIINHQGKEIKKLNEKINIYENLSDLKAKVDMLMRKKGQSDIIEFLIKIIQIVAIVTAGFLILRALNLA